MRRWFWLSVAAIFLLLFVLFWQHVARAGEVTITLPDAQLHGVMTDIENWHHTCRDLDDQAKAQCVASVLVKLISLGHYQNLQAIGATMRVTFDHEAP